MYIVYLHIYVTFPFSGVWHFVHGKWLKMITFILFQCALVAFRSYNVLGNSDETCSFNFKLTSGIRNNIGKPQFRPKLT